MPNIVRTIFLFITLLMTSVDSHAEIKATVDRTSIFLGESLTLSIVSDQNTNGQPDFTILDAVFHVGQTGRSSSTKIINGEVSTETSWQVLLVPKSLGSHIIPPLEVDGERTQSIKIEVKKPDPNAKASGDIFIEIETNKDSAFVQEEILLTARLLYAINLKNGSLSEPSADGVIVQQINKGANYTTQRNGKTYQVLERKYAIFAENSGTLTLNPLIFEGEVTDNSRQSFSMFQRGRPVRQVSPMLELEIKQIPQSFVNQDWIPAKQINLQQSWSQNKPYQVGEPITRTINLTATGLSETQLPDLTIPEINGAKIYQDKTDTMTRTDGQQLIASKVIKYAVIPTTQGLLNIPEFQLEWFDTQTQTAQTASIPATTLTIQAADAATTQAPPAIDFNPPVIQSNENISSPMKSAEGAYDLMLWKTLTFCFAAFWLLTFLYFWRRPYNPTNSAQKETTKQNPVSLSGLNQMNNQELQNRLIAWWNQEYHQFTTNLGQIRQQLDDKTMREALMSLQQNLYSQDHKKLDTNWQQMIKQGLFKPSKATKKTPAGLPELYS